MKLRDKQKSATDTEMKWDYWSRESIRSIVYDRINAIWGLI